MACTESTQRLLGQASRQAVDVLYSAGRGGGSTNRSLSHGRSISGAASRTDDGSSIEGTAAGSLRTACKVDAEPGAPVWAAVRPEKIAMARHA
jgi:hypothetical protein